MAKALGLMYRMRIDRRPEKNEKQIKKETIKNNQKKKTKNKFEDWSGSNLNNN